MVPMLFFAATRMGGWRLYEIPTKPVGRPKKSQYRFEVLDGTMTIWRLVEMVSVLSVAEMVTLKVPATVGDPETTPAAGSTLSPGGRPDAPKPTGPVPPEVLHWSQ